MNAAARVLVLVRHGKAETREDNADHPRKLTSRGSTDAAAAGRWLAGKLDRVDLAWVSSATRAVQTWEAMTPSLPEPAQVRVERALYLAGAREVTDRVAAADVPVLLVVGHNPTLEQVLAALTGTLHPLRPGAVAVMDLGAGRLVEHLEPGR